jgi:hypothetical protein
LNDATGLPSGPSTVATPLVMNPIGALAAIESDRSASPLNVPVMTTNSGASTSLSPCTTTEYEPASVPRPVARLRSSAPVAFTVHFLTLGAISFTHTGHSGVPSFAQPESWATAVRRPPGTTLLTNLPAASLRYMSSVTS